MTTVATGKSAPEFTLPDLQGKKRSLAEALKGGPVALAFFKVSCPVCQYALPFLERIYKAYGEGKVTVLGISQDGARDTREFCKEYGLTFPSLVDEEGYPVSNRYGLTTVPTILLVQPGGKVRVSGTGFTRRDMETIAKEFAAHLGKPVAAVFQAGEAIPDYKPG